MIDETLLANLEYLIGYWSEDHCHDLPTPGHCRVKACLARGHGSPTCQVKETVAHLKRLLQVMKSLPAEWGATKERPI